MKFKFTLYLCLTTAFSLGQSVLPTSRSAFRAYAQTAGCGSGWSRDALSVLSPIGSRQFRVACNEHDECYDTLGESKADCDRAFHRRMLDICARDHNTILGRPLKIACNGRADAYHRAVVEGGQSAYDAAQAAASDSQLPRVAVIQTDINGRVFDFTNSERPSEPVILVDRHGGVSQQWNLIPVDDSHYLIESPINGRVFDFTNSERPSEPVILVDRHGGVSQQWKFERLANGKFLIVSRVNGRVLDFTNSERPGEPVILVDRHEGASQQWAVNGL